MPAYARKTARRPLPGPGQGGVGVLRPPRAVVRRDAGLWACEGALRRRGFELVAGADEAGRGACAGPLVIAACVLPDGRRGQVPDLADSKLLTPATRERVYAEVVRRAVAWSVVIVPPGEVDARGLHVSNIEGMRRAVVALDPRPSYALTDGFPVAGLGVPALAVPKGDAAVACIAAASVIAKVTRDRIMVRLHDRWPEYDFATHKGYVTPGHAAALADHGPCPEHRFSYINVRRLSALAGRLDAAALAAALRQPADPADPVAEPARVERSGNTAEVPGVPDPAVRDDVWVEGVTA
jgi:ribonuclease HII